MKNELSVREMKVDDIYFIIDYFYNGSEDFIKGMGAIKNKLPERKLWHNLILSEVKKNILKRKTITLFGS